MFFNQQFSAYPEIDQYINMSEEALLSLLKGRSVFEQKHAIKVMALRGLQSSVAPIIDLLKSSESEIFFAAMEALGVLKDARAFDPIMQILLTDPDGEVKNYAAFALSFLIDAPTFEKLLEKVDQVDPDTRYFIVSALTDYDWKSEANRVKFVDQLLEDPDPEIRKLLLAYIGDYRLASFQEKLYRLVVDSVEPYDVRKEACFALTRLGDRRSLPLLREVLKKDREDQMNALYGIMALKDREAIPDLKQIFERWFQPRLVKLLAAAALYSLGQTEYEAFFLKQLNSRNLSVRGVAILKAGEFQIQPAIPPLIAMVKDVRDFHRSMAILALGMYQPPQGGEAIRQLIHDPQDDVSLAVCKFLIGSNDRLDLVKAQLQKLAHFSVDFEVRKEAAQALETPCLKK